MLGEFERMAVIAKCNGCGKRITTQEFALTITDKNRFDPNATSTVTEKTCNIGLVIWCPRCKEDVLVPLT